MLCCVDRYPHGSWIINSLYKQKVNIWIFSMVYKNYLYMYIQFLHIWVDLIGNKLEEVWFHWFIEDIRLYTFENYGEKAEFILFYINLKYFKVVFFLKKLKLTENRLNSNIPLSIEKLNILLKKNNSLISYLLVRNLKMIHIRKHRTIKMLLNLSVKDSSLLTALIY